MKEREWLAQQGLAILGARGKFSHKAKAALAKARADGIDIESLTVDEKAVDSKKVIKFTDDKFRTETVVWGIDKATGPGTTDLLIALSSCYGCNKTISRCSHDVPLLPSWLGGGEALLIKPN